MPTIPWKEFFERVEPDWDWLAESIQDTADYRKYRLAEEYEIDCAQIEVDARRKRLRLKERRRRWREVLK